MLSAQYDMNCTGVITIIVRHMLMPRLAGQLNKPHADESAKAIKPRTNFARQSKIEESCSSLDTYHF